MTFRLNPELFYTGQRETFTPGGSIMEGIKGAVNTQLDFETVLIDSELGRNEKWAFTEEASGMLGDF